MSRLPNLDETSLSDAQQEVHDAIVNGPRGKVAGPLRVWLQSPGLAAQAQTLGQYVRYDSTLPAQLSELAILVTARYWGSGFEWSHHAPIAAKAGVPEAAIDAISNAQAFTFEDAQMQAVFAFCVELHRDKRVSEPVYRAALDALGTQACVDLVGICGYYTLISMTINTFDVPDGEGPKLAQLSMPLEAYFKA